MRQYLPLIILLIVVAAIVWGAFRMRDRFEILGEFIIFLHERKLWWIMPLLIVFALAGLFVVITSSSPLGAFIYTLF
ncbi:MAG: DUF5989 family protein [bacterium]|nr:DUF5989 family protein [Candidatus Sumerlaeota bacterium]